LFDFLAGLTRQNPMHHESPLVDEQEQADMQALDARFSSSSNIRDVVALYNARTSNRH
jgi:hypothetical protein